MTAAAMIDPAGVHDLQHPVTGVHHPDHRDRCAATWCSLQALHSVGPSQILAVVCLQPSLPVTAHTVCVTRLCRSNTSVADILQRTQQSSMLCRLLCPHLIRPSQNSVPADVTGSAVSSCCRRRRRVYLHRADVLPAGGRRPQVVVALISVRRVDRCAPTAPSSAPV